MRCGRNASFHSDTRKYDRDLTTATRGTISEGRRSTYGSFGDVRATTVSFSDATHGEGSEGGRQAGFSWKVKCSLNTWRLLYYDFFPGHTGIKPSGDPPGTYHLSTYLPTYPNMVGVAADTSSHLATCQPCVVDHVYMVGNSVVPGRVHSCHKDVPEATREPSKCSSHYVAPCSVRNGGIVIKT